MTRHRSTEYRKSQILDAALVCMIEAGFKGTRVADIAARAGLSKGAVYFHFSNKDAVLLALVEREFSRAIQLLDGPLEQVGADTSFAAFATGFVQFLGQAEDPRHRFFVLVGDLAVHDPTLRTVLHGHHTTLLGRLTELIRRWAGPSVADPEAAAVLLKAMADGLQGSWALGYTFDSGRLFASALSLISLSNSGPASNAVDRPQ